MTRYVVSGALVLLWLFAAIRMAARTDSIDVTRETVEGLARARQEIAGRPPTESERRRIVSEYINDEVPCARRTRASCTGATARCGSGSSS